MLFVLNRGYNKIELINGYSGKEATKIRVEGLEECVEVLSNDHFLKEELSEICDVDQRRERFLGYVQRILGQIIPNCNKYLNMHSLNKIARRFEEETEIHLGYASSEDEQR